MYYLLAILQRQAANILHSVAARATYEDTAEATKQCYGDHKLVEVYWSQLKARTQLTCESLQEFAEAVEHLAHLSRGMSMHL
jgi:phosphohistidine phosphatase SixA